MSTTKHLIGVYGTLKEGYGNNRLLHGMPLIKRDYAKIKGLSGGGFPTAEFILEGDVEPEDYAYVAIEIYGVTDEALTRLDSLEGHPNWYRREYIVTHSGERIQIYNMAGIEGFKVQWDTGENIDGLPVYNFTYQHSYHGN